MEYFGVVPLSALEGDIFLTREEAEEVAREALDYEDPLVIVELHGVVLYKVIVEPVAPGLTGNYLLTVHSPEK